jgi:hypothetical protein
MTRPVLAASEKRSGLIGEAWTDGKITAGGAKSKPLKRQTRHYMPFIQFK